MLNGFKGNAQQWTIVSRGAEHGVLQHIIDTGNLTFLLHLSWMSAIAEVYDPSCRHLDLWFDMSFIILVYSTGVHTEKVSTFVTISFCSNYSLSCYAQHVCTMVDWFFLFQFRRPAFNGGDYYTTHLTRFTHAQFSRWRWYLCDIIDVDAEGNRVWPALLRLQPLPYADIY